ncbi:MAG: N-acetylmuramoyl-L-alanine amidase [Acidobacteriota bacterium]|nr:N-acetylmuramoyl-L-alanine amidase [Acidobacteriota bacterium]
MSSRASWALLAVMLAVAVPVTAVQRVPIGNGQIATVTAGAHLVLEAPPFRHEGLIRFVERLCVGDDARRQVQEMNDGTSRLLYGVRYKVPFEILRPELQRTMMHTLFGHDTQSSVGWRHRVADERVGLWTLARWFTGVGENFRAIRAHNALDDEALAVGQEILIPRSLLLNSLRAALPTMAEGPTPFEGYGRDTQGEYAIYELERGEALYSSVVIRFTARIHADEVNRLADEVAARSAIADVRNIPVGYPVKIPLEELAPEFLPIDHARRVEYEEGLTQSAQYANPARSRDLEGVTVILDSGHGGRDVGASIDGVWESLYVYDIAMRVRRILSDSTSAEVIVTTRDGDDFAISQRDVLAPSRGHAVLTQPPYAIHDSRVSSNLRWYLANSVYSQAVSRKAAPDRVVFLSIHADSLHPSIRGAMVYVPGLLRNPPNYGKTGDVYTSRREVQERPQVDFSRDERVRSEGLSRDMAGELVASFRREGLAIHPNQPIRDRVIRNRRAWVPAVLRFNAVPAKVLLEVCNLANEQDRRLMQTQKFREQIATAIVEGLTAYYGGSQVGAQVARAAGAAR